MTKNFIFSYSYCSCSIFLTLYSFYIPLRLILISIDVQYLQNTFPLTLNAFWKTLLHLYDFGMSMVWGCIERYYIDVDNLNISSDLE